MSFLGGSKASLEKLTSAKEELLVAEQRLMSVRSIILGQIEEQELLSQHLQSLETAKQDHLERAEEVNSLCTTYSVQINELKDQIETLRGLIQDAEKVKEHHQGESTRILGDIEKEAKAKQQLELEMDVHRLTFKQQKKERKAVNTAMEKASKADRKKRHGGPSKGKVTLNVNNHPIHTLHALGDIHGWAPGLINYMQAHGLAGVSIPPLAFQFSPSV